MRKRVAVLGSTGSIGKNTLAVCRAFPDLFEVVLLSAGRQRSTMEEQVEHWRPECAVLAEGDGAALPHTKAEGTRWFFGQEGLGEALDLTKPDLVVSAMVGSAGLLPTLHALTLGARVALANKESMVIAGTWMKQTACLHGGEIIPVDSEHSAIFQCLNGHPITELKRIILTASGGPFRSFHGDFSQITPEQALKHPTWNMGPKISVDSATLMNKGLEVIEAFQLFDVAPEQIDVVVHPQSVIHSLVEWQDGSLISQLGCADMRHPIQYAMSYPHRLTAPFASFDLTAMGSLTFEPPRRESFPCLDLAYEALKRPETGPVILNAANEQAVDAFLRGALAFSDIPRMIEKALERFDHASVYNLEDVLCLDREVRQVFGRN